jgi:hypothetical protein
MEVSSLRKKEISYEFRLQELSLLIYFFLFFELSPIGLTVEGAMNR